MTTGGYIPFVRFRLADGTTAQVSPGGLIGRASSAELKIANPEVSEAHALISLRGHQLHMLSLRRWIILDGERCSVIALRCCSRRSWIRRAVSAASPATAITPRKKNSSHASQSPRSRTLCKCS